MREITGYLKHIRGGEILMACGIPGLAVFFSLERWAGFSPVRFLIFCAAVFLLLAHIYVLNDWAQLKAETAGREGGKSGGLSGVLVFAAILGALALLSARVISFTCFAVTAAMILLSFLYSSPSVNFKAVPVVSSITHFSGVTLLFLSGYVLFHPWDIKGALAAFYFALVICGGHLIHEVGDYPDDSRSGLATNAVRFGRANAFAASFRVFNASTLYLIFLTFIGVIPFLWMCAACSVCLLHFFLFRRALRRGITAPGVLNDFRRGYRSIYLAYGIYAGLIILWRIRN